MDTKVYIERLEDREYISISGKGTMNTIKTISDIIDVLLDEKIKITLDLTHCKYVDSTFLGLIAQTTQKQKLQILNPNDVVLVALKNTGIYKFVDIVNDIDLSNKLIHQREAEKTQFSSNKEHAKYILKMHKILSDLSEDNKIAFENVVKQMENILK